MLHHLDLATAADDDALRALVGAVVAPGAVSLSQRREPSFFAADAALGERVETLVARERPGGAPVAVVQRSVREVFVGGRPVRAAMLSGLRSLAGHGGAGMMARGWAAVRALEAAHPADVTLVSVTAENERTRRLLSVARGAAPRLEALADLVTLALVVRRPRRRLRLRVEADEARADAFRDAWAPRRDLSPVRLFLPGPIQALVSVRDECDVGAVRVWDPAGVRQHVVERYGAGLRRARPLLNAAARLAGIRPLPAPGEVLRVAFAAGLVAPDTEALDALLDAALTHAHRLGAGFLLVGLDRADPLLVHARRRLHLPYTSTLFSVRWTDDPIPVSRPVCAEVATY